MPLKAELVGDRVILPKKPEDLPWIFGFVDKEGKVYLSLTEALYLAEKGVIIIEHNGKELSKEEFIEYAKQYEPRFEEKYEVYKLFREKSYIVGTALKFGADFRVYDKGVLPKKGPRGEREHSKWIVYVVRGEETFSLYEFAAKNRVAHSTRKKLIVAVKGSDKIELIEFSWKRL